MKKVAFEIVAIGRDGARAVEPAEDPAAKVGVALAMFGQSALVAIAIDRLFEQDLAGKDACVALY